MHEDSIISHMWFVWLQQERLLVECQILGEYLHHNAAGVVNTKDKFQARAVLGTIKLKTLILSFDADQLSSAMDFIQELEPELQAMKLVLITDKNCIAGLKEKINEKGTKVGLILEKPLEHAKDFIEQLELLLATITMAASAQ